MRVTGIISEYNPIHNGHAKHIDTARYETGADFIIAVMSGDFVQRGAPAIISKYERAKYALMAGVDLVVELPLYYSTGSLDYFSKGAVSLINRTGVVSCISFGSECGDIDLLKEAASVIHSPKTEKDREIRKSLSEGHNYSTALYSSPDIPGHIKEVLGTPNNLLAASYISSSKELSFDCAFHTTKRGEAAYHDDSIGALSSTAIRREILCGLHNSLPERMPKDVYNSLSDHLKKYPAISEDTYSLLLFARIHEIIRTALCEKVNPAGELTSYLDVSDSLAGKIIKEYAHAPSYSGLCRSIKSKDINYARISRALLHIMLGIKKQYMDEYVDDGYAYFIKVLGFKRSASDLMHALKEHSDIPLITKNADAAKLMDGHALRMFSEGAAASDLYNKTACLSGRQPFRSEYEHTPVIIP